MQIIRIGKDIHNDIIINDNYVSRFHCQIICNDDGSIIIYDLGSTNGTFVNNMRIYGATPLQSTDVVRIGNTTLPWQSYCIDHYTPCMSMPKNGSAKGESSGIEDNTKKKSSTIDESNHNNSFKRCNNGHYYQGEKCPYCKTSSTNFSEYVDGQTARTSRTVFGDECEQKFNLHYLNQRDCPTNDKEKSINHLPFSSARFVGRLILQKREENHEYVLFEGRNTIGRDIECDITINDKFISLRHADIVYRKGVFYITDLQSSHGSFINGNEMEASRLKDGDSIDIGKTSLLFKDDTLTTENQQKVYSSIFAPSEVKQKSHMLVQVYLHLYEETEKVKALAQESDKNAERRDYIPLQCKLKKGDKVDVQLNVYGETLLMSDKKSVVWQGSFTKCSFDFFVPKDIDVDELSCVAMLIVNGMPIGEMRFITRIVDAPRQLNPEIIAHKYNKVFISYSHQDESKVKFLHEGLELGAVPHFFDRKYLKAGDVFPQVIQDYINSADLFILCWSENASKSEYVQKERLQALERAFPQVKPEHEAKLRIYPMSIEPRAELPSDMKENYHFGEM